MRKNKPDDCVLQQATPYPWTRDARGNLVGANGHAIYFMGCDAILVEHAPMLLQTLLAVGQVAAGYQSPEKKLALIRRMVRVQSAKLDSQL